MPRTFALAVLLLLSSTASLMPTAADEPLKIRVLSYNIHHGEGTDAKLDLERIARVISDAKPDLVALQEVDVRTERTGGFDQAAEIAKFTGMQVAFGASMKFQGGEYGNAVLSNWPIASSKVHPLPRFGDGEPRSVFICDIDLPDRGDHLPFLATHFGFHAGIEERLASASSIAEVMQPMKTRPAILAGDLNDVPESRALLKLGETWTTRAGAPLPTVPVEKPTKQIDFILVRPAERWRIAKMEVLSEAVASDHRPILAELELLPAK